MSASERNFLPGGPGNSLIRQVRRILFTYCRSRPQRTDRAWINAWDWARAIRDREEFWQLVVKAKTKRRPWPAAAEIASQYLLLALADMKDARALRLPFHAAECVTPAVVEALKIGDRTQVAALEAAIGTPLLAAPATEGSEA